MFDALAHAKSPTAVVAIIALAAILIIFSKKIKISVRIKIVIALILVAMTVATAYWTGKPKEKNGNIVVESHGDNSPAIGNNTGIINYGNIKK